MREHILSQRLLLATLDEAVTTLKEAEAARFKARAQRDNVIREARRNKVPYRTLAQYTGLSRMQVDRIVVKPDEEV